MAEPDLEKWQSHWLSPVVFLDSSLSREWDTMIYPAFAFCASLRPKVSVCVEDHEGHGEVGGFSKS